MEILFLKNSEIFSFSMLRQVDKKCVDVPRKHLRQFFFVIVEWGYAKARKCKQTNNSVLICNGNSHPWPRIWWRMHTLPCRHHAYIFNAERLAHGEDRPINIICAERVFQKRHMFVGFKAFITWVFLDYRASMISAEKHRQKKKWVPHKECIFRILSACEWVSTT